MLAHSAHGNPSPTPLRDQCWHRACATATKPTSPPRTSETERSKEQLAPQAVAPPTLTEFQQIVAGSTGRVLPIFGAGLFNSRPRHLRRSTISRSRRTTSLVRATSCGFRSGAR